MKRLVFYCILLVFFTTDISNAQNLWEPTNGPNSEDVYSIVANSDGHIFVGTGNGGVFRSMDSGDNWTQINTGLTVNEVAAIVINSSGHIFVGTGNSGVFRSMDNGDNWTQINTGLTVYEVAALVINSDGHIFAGTKSGGVFRSLDNGNNWTQINLGLTENNVQSLSINSDGNIFVGTKWGGIFRSMDNGDNWTQINSGLLVTDIRSIAINSSGNIFAGINNGGVARSTDNGNNWIQTNFMNSDANALVINSVEHIFVASYDSVFISVDNGDNWAQFSTGLPNSNVWSLFINSHGNIFAGLANGVVFRSIYSTTAAKEIDGNIPLKFDLEQNYPNPFNPTTTINFSVPKQSNVTIKIYDALGRELNTLVNEEKSVGNYSVRFEGSNLSSGIYFYQIKSTNYVETKKMILLR